MSYPLHPALQVTVALVSLAFLIWPMVLDHRTGLDEKKSDQHHLG
jgi:hypothetical protein